MIAGAHAADFSTLILASHRRDVWLGGAAENDDSFPLTDGGDLPADSMLRAELTSRSCVTPHAPHTHVLTSSMSIPAGPVRALQSLHSRVVFLSLTIDTRLPACWPLYSSCVLSIPPTGIEHGFCHPGLHQFSATHIANDDILVFLNNLR